MYDSYIVLSSNHNVKKMSITFVLLPTELPMPIHTRHQFCIKCVYINIVVQRC